MDKVKAFSINPQVTYPEIQVDVKINSGLRSYRTYDLIVSTMYGGEVYYEYSTLLLKNIELEYDRAVEAMTDQLHRIFRSQKK
jgi:hypothetical protein